MNSIFESAWAESAHSASDSIATDGFPELLRAVEARLMKLTKTKPYPISKDIYITQRVSKLMALYHPTLLILKENALVVLNELLTSIKIIDWDTKFAYGDFSDHFQYYQNLESNCTIEKGLGVSESPDASPSPHFSEDEDEDSIMDFRATSPSIYEEDPINFYIRDSLFEITKQHIRIKGKFLTAELLVCDLQQQNEVDLATLSDLADSNVNQLLRMERLRQDLVQAHNVVCPQASRPTTSKPKLLEPFSFPMLSEFIDLLVQSSEYLEGTGSAVTNTPKDDSVVYEVARSEHGDKDEEEEENKEEDKEEEEEELESPNKDEESSNEDVGTGEEQLHNQTEIQIQDQNPNQNQKELQDLSQDVTQIDQKTQLQIIQSNQDTTFIIILFISLFFLIISFSLSV